MHKVRLAVLMLCLAFPLAHAQTEATITTTVTPADYYLPMTVHPDEIQPASLRVQGEIQCQPLTDAPMGLSLVYAGSTIEGQYSDGEKVIFLKVGLGDLNLTWNHAGNNRYTIDQTFEVPLHRDGIPPQDVYSSNRWDSAQLEQQGTPRCDPQGYFWNVDDHFFNVTVEGFGEIEDNSSSGFTKEAPFPVSLALAALVALAFAKLK
ncbi:MAG: hypothetical protein ACPHK8_00935 [Thermoplasmatota archaeon]